MTFSDFHKKIITAINNEMPVIIIYVNSTRWIKYEEDLNAEKGQWGKPHVATLSFKALVNLRLCMEGGTLMLDVTVRDLPELLHRCR